MLTVGSIRGCYAIDAEHQRIIQELLQLGISPTYNKAADKALLAKAKAELLQKLHKKEEENTFFTKELKDSYYQNDSENSFRAELEEKRIGAMTLAELNKFFLVLA